VTSSRHQFHPLTRLALHAVIVHPVHHQFAADGGVQGEARQRVELAA